MKPASRIPLLPLLATLLALSRVFASPPNIVLFVTDDQSPIAGCYGSPVIQTPHLDRLAAEVKRKLKAELDDNTTIQIV